MIKQCPYPHTSFPLSIDLYGMLCTASVDSGFKLEMWEIGAMAIREWLGRHKPELFPEQARPGYQWKNLFLPHGTSLRTKYAGRTIYCYVDGDVIIHDGQETSPSLFANSAGGVNRNAWKAVWLLLPEATSWKPAAALRPPKQGKAH